MTIEIDEAVWQRWEDATAFTRKAAVAFVLNTTADRKVAVDVLRAAVSDAVHARDPGDALPDGFDEPRSGVCKVMLGGDGAILEVSEDPDDFRGLLALIAEGAERRGLSGRLVPMAAAPLCDLPEEAAVLLECRMRVSGERGGEPPHDHWYADGEAFRTVLMGAAQWCLGLAPTRGTYLQATFGSMVAVDAREDLETQLVDAIAESPHTLTDFVSAGTEAIRIVSFHPAYGRITLIDAADNLSEGDAWRASLADERAVLVDQALRLAYAFVKRGSYILSARQAKSLWNDWPAREGVRATPGRGLLFEDRYVPDAFAVQLLGPGHQQKEPLGSDWHQTELDGQKVLVEHAEPERWFDHAWPRKLVAALGGAAAEAPAVLGSARADFKDLLYDNQDALPR